MIYESLSTEKANSHDSEMLSLELNYRRAQTLLVRGCNFVETACYGLFCGAYPINLSASNLCLVVCCGLSFKSHRRAKAKVKEV